MNKKGVSYHYDVCVPSDMPAGLYGLTEKVIIIVKSGDPGGDEGEFEEHMRQALAEWYDTGGVILEKW
jgi:hypothetical protein